MVETTIVRAKKGVGEKLKLFYWQKVEENSYKHIPQHCMNKLQIRIPTQFTNFNTIYNFQTMG